MKKTISLLFLVWSILFAASAQTDTTLIRQVYESFESTVKNKEGSAHLGLYASRHAPVYIVKKNPSGPSTLGLLNAQGFVNNFTSGSQPYELRISDIQYHSETNFAITNARFDEYINGNRSGFGRDLFGYVRTLSGWKLLFLHNTVVFDSDATDYSTPHPMINTIDEVLADFMNGFNANTTTWTDEFLRMDNQVISINESFPSVYNYNNHELRDYLNFYLDSLQSPNLSFTGTDTIICDDYLASVFANYTLKDGETTLEQGRCYFNFFANAQHGWKLTSWIRDNDYSPTTGIESTHIQNIKIYPNPTRGELFIESALQIPAKWSIHESSNGKMLDEGKLSPQRESIQLNQLKLGNYIICISTLSGEPIHTQSIVLH